MPRAQRSIALFALLPAVIAGCEIFSLADRTPLGSGGGTSSSTGGSSTGGDGGSGGATTHDGGPGVECLSAIGCEGEDSDCTVRTCIAGRCGTAPAAEGVPTSTQIAGDCVRSVCDGKGGQKIVPDDLDVSIDGNGCTEDTCSEGVASNLPSEAGRACVEGGGTVCDGAGHCVACVSAAQCVGGTCVNNACVSLSCGDAALSAGETDVDCGGSVCPRCAAGKKCLAPSDCLSHVCVGEPATCLPPSCGDNVQNGTETDVDCGGGDCTQGCGAGKSCVVDADCKGGLCAGGACAPTCIDEEKNLDETGVDCGGSCSPCNDGKACAFDGDCKNHVCAVGVCITPVATCANNALDESESGVDCGGPACAGCGAGAPCALDGDCASRRCLQGVCGDLVRVSELRTRGAGGAHDEFVELYNPLDTDVTLDVGFTVSVRSAIGACASNTEKVLFTGSGEVIAPRGHLLVGGSAYTQSPAADVALSPAGIPDAGSLVVRSGGAVMDAICYAYDATTTANLTGCSAPYVCEGAPADNRPHDNTQSPMSSVDASLERKPGGALGSGRDTGDSSGDFKPVSPALPESGASAPAP